MVEEVKLFESGDNELTNCTLLSKLISLGCADCDVLYIHSELNFGLPNKRLSRKEILNNIIDVIQSLHVDTIIFPVFTFSFCNKEVFDVQNSASSMGALNEYVRKHVLGYRTKDPILSNYIIGKYVDVEPDNIYTLGLDSGFDKLTKMNKKVKFLFLGADPNKCFTYTHYVEAMIGVPYRYNREFRGDIVNYNNVDKDKISVVYTGYSNFKPTSKNIISNQN